MRYPGFPLFVRDLDCDHLHAMPSNEKIKRFGNLFRLPRIAALDHRLFLDENGKDRRLATLPRRERRKMAAGAKKIAAGYRQLLHDIKRIWCRDIQ